MAAESTSDYYKKNPEARRRRNLQQAKYNKTKYGMRLRISANRANRKLGTYGNGDGKDAAHTSPNHAKLEDEGKNRSNPRKGKRYSSGRGLKIRS
jgi:hypothetical protein